LFRKVKLEMMVSLTKARYCDIRWIMVQLIVADGRRSLHAKNQTLHFFVPEMHMVVSRVCELMRGLRLE